jgi:hydroxyethylthiazole kinase-like uncharacterized protein yjeF
VITFAEARALDLNAVHLGVRQGDMMERAGTAVAAAVLERMGGRGKRVLVVCGAGNNGGDGFVAARHLVKEAKVSVIVVGRENDGSNIERNEKSPASLVKIIREGAARENFERLSGLVPVHPWQGSLEGADIVVDALLGVGAGGEVREPYLSCIGAINALGKKVVSVDVPSGLGTGVAIKPRLTVTFHDAKEGMDRATSGEIVVADVGIPREAGWVGPGDLKVFYPRPRKGSHKGDNGRVLVVGGGPYAGAPALAALAALRVGADLAHVAAPEPVARTIASFSMDLIVRPLEGTRLQPSSVDECLRMAADADVVLVGPGLGRAKETLEAVRQLVAECKAMLVVDADAIEAVGRQHGLLAGKAAIVTPHAGEFEALTGEKLGEEMGARRARVAALAKSSGAAILQKGPVDVISDGRRTRESRTGNDAMTVGGTGDVLAGLCAGLMAKGAPPFEAACLAAWLNGTAGDEAFAEMSYGLLASDVLGRVPSVLRKYL